MTMQFNPYHDRILMQIARRGFATTTRQALSARAAESIAAQELEDAGWIETRWWRPTTKSGKPDKRFSRQAAERRFYPTDKGAKVADTVLRDWKERYARAAATLAKDHTTID
jgi:hypothetical protein